MGWFNHQLAGNSAKTCPFWDFFFVCDHFKGCKRDLLQRLGLKRSRLESPGMYLCIDVESVLHHGVKYVGVYFMAIFER